MTVSNDIRNNIEIGNKLAPFKHFLDKQWYIQGFNAVPCFIYIGPTSGIYLCKKYLGYAYKHFVISFETDSCDFFYDREDLHYMAHQFFETELEFLPKFSFFR